MRIAICASDRDERYALSRLTEETLLRRGILPELSLFHMPQELLEAALRQDDRFDLVFLADVSDAKALRSLCRKAPVICSGLRQDGVAAFDMGAGYFMETPVTAEKLNKALSRCLPGKRAELFCPPSQILL